MSIFFAPIFASIPPWATGSALVIVGSLMIRNVRDINWDYIGDALPAFLTILIIPLSYKYVFVASTRCTMTEVLQHCVWCHCRRYELYHSQRHRLGLAQSDRRPHFTPQLGCIGTMGHSSWWYHPPVDVSLRCTCFFGPSNIRCRKYLLNRRSTNVTDAASEYPFQVRHRHSDISIDSQDPGSFTPKNSSFVNSEK